LIRSPTPEFPDLVASPKHAAANALNPWRIEWAALLNDSAIAVRCESTTVEDGLLHQHVCIYI
jgi:hypothetical protein